ncbi:uncharacterized protein LOC126735635 isoform X2 [Anthonomus grandis grandis]|uniref:uncharacterized protein LOC126735635 isoform X2 n=1 Tax=Anthonomus grandis grandis TaxID=2921223 RepID=UPI002166514C|nr:uncharacterized protein LOC126735635 isoform X2 [Anthonomus grandis grandis]
MSDQESLITINDLPMSFTVKYLEITKEGIQGEVNKFPVEIISYGVQDLVYTRVFSIITVQDQSLKCATPFMCHSFVCDSRDQARRLTYALAAVFQDYGRKIKEEAKATGMPIKRLTIDLRTPEEQAEGLDEKETDA